MLRHLGPSPRPPWLLKGPRVSQSPAAPPAQPGEGRRASSRAPPAAVPWGCWPWAAGLHLPGLPAPRSPSTPPAAPQASPAAAAARASRAPAGRRCPRPSQAQTPPSVSTEFKQGQTGEGYRKQTDKPREQTDGTFIYPLRLRQRFLFALQYQPGKISSLQPGDSAGTGCPAHVCREPRGLSRS